MGRTNDNRVAPQNTVHVPNATNGRTVFRNVVTRESTACHRALGPRCPAGTKASRNTTPNPTMLCLADTVEGIFPPPRAANLDCDIQKHHTPTLGYCRESAIKSAIRRSKLTFQKVPASCKVYANERKGWCRSKGGRRGETIR